MAKIKIEIKNRWTGSILFEYEKENNTIKDTLLEALKSGADLRGADLRGANLGGANLGGANLGGANLGGANLGDANLRDANLGDANLRDAYLGGANLRGADLRGANLGGAYLGDANLRNAYLRDAYLGDAYLGDANLGGANLRGANLRGAKNIPYIPFACPSDGAFIGWKKVGTYLIELEIPADARRQSATGTKCRCDKAKVVSIVDLVSNERKSLIVNTNYTPLKYAEGQMVYPDSFDENRWDECSHGIHFFINKQEAINY